MKTCSKCAKSLKEDAFPYRNKAKGTRQSACKECLAVAVRAHYHANKSAYKARNKVKNKIHRQDTRARLKQYLTEHPCVDCGESDLAVLDFDHVKGKKEFSIAQAQRLGVSAARLAREIAKCEVRCANCHRRKTAAERGWFRGEE